MTANPVFWPIWLKAMQIYRKEKENGNMYIWNLNHCHFYFIYTFDYNSTQDKNNNEFLYYNASEFTKFVLIQFLASW